MGAASNHVRIVASVVTILGVPLGACASHDGAPAPSATTTTLPQPGLDASYAGVYAGSAAYVTGASAPSADAGAPAPDAGGGYAGASASEMRIVSADGSLDHLAVRLEDCEVTATVDTRRYDYAGTTERPLTVATAIVDPRQTCDLRIDRGVARTSIDYSRLTLFADGSLELVMSGAVEGSPAGGGASYLTYTFEGRKVEAACNATLPNTLPKVCSTAGDTPTWIRFSNQCTLRTITLYWVDYDCQEISAGDVPPGGESTQNTRVTHPWRVRDAKTGELLKELPPATPDGQTVTIP